MAEHDVKLDDFSSIFSLRGKVAVVTGGSRGLGLHAASGMMQAGCSKVYITSRKAEACEAACKALNALPNKAPGAQAIPVPADSSKLSEVERLVAEVGKSTEHVDILFANAGATWGAPFDKHTDASFSKVMDLNVKSVFFVVQKYVFIRARIPRGPTDIYGCRFAPLLAKAASLGHPSKVIATASVAGLGIGTTGENSVPSYSASKAAVIHLMHHLCVDLGPLNITCNAIAPGFFPSKMASGLIEKSGGMDKLAKEVPMGRLGIPDDIAGLVVFLCSRASDHVNGATVAVDGGRTWGRSQL